MSQLIQLPKEVLELHLTSRYIQANGTKRNMATKLFDAVHERPLAMGLRKRQSGNRSVTFIVTSFSFVSFYVH